MHRDAIALSIAILALCSLPGMASDTGQLSAASRAFVILVDDGGYQPADAQRAGRLLEILRDDVSTRADLISVISTGPSSVATDLGWRGSGARLSDVIRRISAAPPLVPSAARQSGRLADVALITAADVLSSLETVNVQVKHFVLLASAGTASVTLERALGPAADDAFARASEAARKSGARIHVILPTDPSSADRLRRLR